MSEVKKVKQYNDPHMRQKKEVGLGELAEKALENPEEEVPNSPPEVDKDIEAMIPGMAELNAVPEDIPLPQETTPAPELVEESRPQAEQLMETMQTEIMSLRKEVQDVRNRAANPAHDPMGDLEGVSGYPWQFYRRPDGWICSGSGGAGPSGRRNDGAYSRYISGGHEPIDDYGPAPIPVSTNLAVSLLPLLRNGGEKEFPVSQVLEYGWHVNPPLPGLKFPAIEKVYDSLKYFVCEECDTELWANGEDGTDVVRLSRVSFAHLRDRHNYTRKEANLMLGEQDLPEFGRHAIERAKERARPVLAPSELVDVED